MTSKVPELDELLAQIGRASSAQSTINDVAYSNLRELDRFGAAAVAPLMELIDRNQDIWFDVQPPLFWLVERAAVEARGLFLRHLGRGDRRDLCVRGLLRAGAAAEAIPLLADASPAVRLGAAFTLACAPEVAAEAPLREALSAEVEGETALALRLALLRRGIRASMSERAFTFAGADTPAHPAWSRFAWLRDGAIGEVAESFDAEDDAHLDAALAARAAGDAGPLGAAWRSGAALSIDAGRGIEALLGVQLTYAPGCDFASGSLLLACARQRLDAASIGLLSARVPAFGAAMWASESWIDAEGARLEKGKSKQVYLRLNTLSATDRPEAVQWQARGLRSLVFHGYRHSLWRSVGPLKGVATAIERLEVMPDHGLSASGERVLQRGALAATVRLSREGELLFVDAAGKLRKSLPKPKTASTLDIEAVKVAHKELSRRVENSWRLAGETFESAMIAGRRYSPEAWRARFVEHPIGASVGASLIFLTDEGRSFWMGEGAPRDLAANEVIIDAPVRIAHPVDLSPEELEGWRARLGDRPLPFAQLARAVHSPTLPEIAPGPYSLGPLLVRLRERGYVSGRTAPYVYHARHVGPYFTLVIEHAPLPWNRSSGDLELTRVCVRRDELDVPAEAVPRALLSELREDLARLEIEIVR